LYNKGRNSVGDSILIVRGGIRTYRRGRNLIVSGGGVGGRSREREIGRVRTVGIRARFDYLGFYKSIF